jgi:hypothetical protein
VSRRSGPSAEAMRKARYADRIARLKEPVANKLEPPPASPDSIMALHRSQRGAAPELRSGLRGRHEMRIVHRREGMPHCVLGPEPQFERLFRLAF